MSAGKKFCTAKTFLKRLMKDYLDIEGASLPETFKKLGYKNWSDPRLISDFGDTFFGDRCQCPGNHSNPLNPESSCRQDSQLQLCSGRGSCECGVCQCDKQPDMEVWGQFCECDNVSCDRSSGE